MNYRVQRSEVSRDSFGAYRYRILDGDKIVAEYWHDYRGDEHGIEFVGGKVDSLEQFQMMDFLVGGGPQTLALSKKAIAYLERNR